MRPRWQASGRSESISTDSRKDSRGFSRDSRTGGFPRGFPDTHRLILPYELQDYLELVDWSGRAIVEGKRGRIPNHLPPILERLNINPDHYLRFINRTEKSRFHNFIGAVDTMRAVAEQFGKTFLKGQTAAAQLFSLG